MSYGLLTPSKIFLTTLVVWLIGLLWPHIHLPAWGLILLLVLLLFSLVVWSWRWFTVLFLLIAVLFFSSSYYHWYLHKITPSIRFNNKTQLELTVYDKPTKIENRSYYLGKTKDRWYISLVLPRTTVIEPGTTIVVEGALLTPGQEDDASYRLALAKRHIFAKMNYPIILHQSPAKLSFWEVSLIKSRKKFEQIITRLFPEPQAALFSSLVTGIKSELGRDIIEQFRLTGLSHLVAVSGYNITILIKLLTTLTRRFRRVFDILCSLSAIIFFVFFTGASASVIRAGILASLFIVGLLLGRKTSIIRLLLVTAVIMTFINPLSFLHDIGFQLSFAAMVGLIYFAEPIENRLTKWHWPAFAAEIVAATTAAQLTTLPLLLYHFGTFSPYSIIANVLVGPIVSLFTGAGILLVLIGSLLLPLAEWLFLPYQLVLTLILSLTSFMSKLPFTEVRIPTIPAVLWVYYLLLLFFTYPIRSKQTL